MKTKLLKYGIEIEGEYSTSLSNIMEKMGTMKYDGSVNLCSIEHEKVLHAQEFASLPMEMGNKKQKNIFSLLQKEYENNNFCFNETCGFHVHISFKPKIPPELLSKNFIEYFYSKMSKKFPMEYRKRQNNTYCRAIVLENKDILHSTNRYYGINIMPSIKKHKTIEFRIFPASEPVKMYSYLAFIFSTVKSFLNKKITEKQEVDEKDVCVEYETKQITDTVKISKKTINHYV